MILYDLCIADGRAISPYCWRIRESLHLLGLPFEHRLLHLGEVRNHFDGRHRTVPVLSDGEVSLSDSRAIAGYLARTYDPDNRLFGRGADRRLTEFVTDWVDAGVMGQINRMVAADLHVLCRPGDQAYFRESEEKRLGVTLEQALVEREGRRPALQVYLHPARRAVKTRPFLTGDAPNYADFTLHGAFRWSRAVSDFELLREDDRLRDWIERMDDWFARPIDTGT